MNPLSNPTSHSGITMKKSMISVAILTVAFAATPALGQEGKKGRDARKPGERRPSERRPSERRPGAAAQRDPAQMVARLIREFDKDNDQKLNAAELTAMLKSMRDRRGNFGGDMRRGGPAGRRPGGLGTDVDRRRRMENREAGKPGGDRPRRPDSGDDEV